MERMRATLVGRFLLLAVLALIVLVPLWYMASPTFARPPTWIAGSAMEKIFPWVKSFEVRGIQSVLHTAVQARARGPAAPNSALRRPPVRLFSKRRR